MAHKLVWNRAVADANGRIAVRARWNRPLGLPQNSPLVCHHWQPLVCGHLDPIVGSNQWFLGGSCVAAIPDRFLPCHGDHGDTHSMTRNDDVSALSLHLP